MLKRISDIGKKIYIIIICIAAVLLLALYVYVDGITAPVFKTNDNTKEVGDAPPESPYMNVLFDVYEKRIILSKTFKKTINIDEIEHTDLYTAGRYVLTLNGSYGEMFEKKEYFLGDGPIEKLIVSEENGKTNLIIEEKEIFGYILSEDESNIYINAVSPRQLYKKIVVVDPGHGGIDPGTDRNLELLEKDVTLDISNRLVYLLNQSPDIKVYATRSYDKFVSLSDRTDIGNNTGDLFISVHINSNEHYSEVHGTETFYQTNEGETAYNLPESEMAEILNNAVVKNLASNDRGVKEEPYAVLGYSEIPSLLCELGFMSNASEAAKFNGEDYRQKAAIGLYDGIVEIFDAYNPPRTQTQ